MEQQRNSFKRKSISSSRSKSSDMSIQHIIQQFQSKIPHHQNFIYHYVDDSITYKRKSRGSDLLNKLQQPTFKIPNKNYNSNNYNYEALQIMLQISAQSNKLNKQFGIQSSAHSCSCYTTCQTINCPCYSDYSSCVYGRCCSMCIQLKNYILSLRQKNSEENLETNSVYACACKKTRCLKMYCECFAKNGYCTQKCDCQDCLNKNDSQIRDRAKLELQDLDQKGCRCKRTKCEKKYCKCYGNNEKCNKYCQCENCNNMSPQLKQIRTKKQHIKYQQEIIYMPPRAPCSELPIDIEFQEPDFSQFNNQTSQ